MGEERSICFKTRPKISKRKKEKKKKNSNLLVLHKFCSSFEKK